MKTIKKLIAAIVVATLLTPTAHVHAMNEAQEDAVAQESAQLISAEQLKLNNELLEHCTQCNVSRAMDTLIKGADINAKNERNRTALELACRNNGRLTTYWLVVAGADTTVAKEPFPKLEETIVHAATERHTKIVQPLAILKTMLCNNFIQDYVPLHEIARIIADYLVPHYRDGIRSHDDFMNSIVAREWTHIKAELAVNRKKRKQPSSEIPTREMVDAMETTEDSAMALDTTETTENPAAAVL